MFRTPHSLRLMKSAGAALIITSISHFACIDIAKAQTAPGAISAAGSTTQSPASSGATNQAPGAAVLANNADTSAAQIDPRARQLMDQMIAAHNNLKSFSCNMELVTKSGLAESRTVATIAFQKPNRIALKVQDEMLGTISSVSNGTNYFLLLENYPTKYLKVMAPMGPMAVTEVLGGIRGTGPGLVPLVSGIDPLSSMAERLKSLTVGPPETLDGVAVETVIAEVVAGQDTLKATYAIGREDHLLRRLVGAISSQASNRAVTLTETYRNVKANPALAASTFVFTPPRGAVSVVELDLPKYDPRLKVGAKPFPFMAKDHTGKPLNLEQDKGKVVLVDFWATWCPPCIAEMPNVVAAYNEFKGKGFDIIGVSLDQDRASMVSFMQSRKMPWRQVFDGMGEQGQLARMYKVIAVPFTMLLDREGKIAALNVRGEALHQEIRKALAPAKKVRKRSTSRRRRRR